MNKVVVIKSVIGEEILAEFVNQNDATETIEVSRPRIFQVMQDEKGRQVPSIAPWLMTDPDNKSVHIRMNYIAAVVDAPSAIEKAYMQSTSGIDLGSSIAKA